MVGSTLEIKLDVSEIKLVEDDSGFDRVSIHVGMTSPILPEFQAKILNSEYVFTCYVPHPYGKDLKRQLEDGRT
jgi:hypothetical protein